MRCASAGRYRCARALLLALLAGAAACRLPQGDPERASQGSEPEPEPARPSLPPTETVLYALADGLALAGPDPEADPVMRIEEGERLRWFSEQDGWYRLGGTPTDVEAWVHAEQVRTVEEPREVATDTQRRAIEQALRRSFGDRWVAQTVVFHETEGVLGLTLSLSHESSMDDCRTLGSLVRRLAPGYRMQASVYDDRGSRDCSPAPIP